MAPGSSQGTGKKNSAIHRPSRTSTPVPAPATQQSSLPPERNYDPDFLNSRVILFDNLAIDDIVDHGAASAAVPDSKVIDAVLEKLKSLSGIMEKRSTFYDRGMRYLADERKKRPESYDNVRGDSEHEGKRSKHKRKKGSDSQAPHDGKPLCLAIPCPIQTTPKILAIAPLALWQAASGIFNTGPASLPESALTDRSPYRAIITKRIQTKALPRSRLSKLFVVARRGSFAVGDGRRRQGQEGGRRRIVVKL